MMKRNFDFEVHNVLTHQEVKLSRALARAIQDNIGEVPDEVVKAYLDLKALYQKQIEEGVM